MLKTDGTTTSTPVLLVVLAVLFFAARCFLVSRDLAHPQKPQYEIAWNQVPLTGKNPDNKPILYLFTSRALAPCQELEANTFTNKEVVELVESNFFPVRVEDVGMMKQANQAVVDELEMKYRVSEFPKLVVALRSGRSVRDGAAIVRIHPVKDFLTGALVDVPYCEALDEACEGEYEKAERKFKKYLSMSAPDDASRCWATVFRYVCLKFSGKDGEAQSFLDTGTKKLSQRTWPYPVIAYFKGDLDYAQLEEATVKDFYSQGRSQLRAYAGLRLYFEGDKKAAREHLQWLVTQKETADSSLDKLARHALELMAEPPRPASSKSSSSH